MRSNSVVPLGSVEGFFKAIDAAAQRENKAVLAVGPAADKND